MKTIKDVNKIQFKQFMDNNGVLTPLEFKNLPFEPKRVFYIYGVFDTKKRGEHSHYKTEQVLICLKVNCTVITHDGEHERVDLLSDPSQGLYIPNEIWDTQIFHDINSIVLVLSNTEYDKSDYLTKWEEFLDWKRQNKKFA